MSESAILERLAGFQPDWPDVELRSRRLRGQQLRRHVLLTVGIVAAATVLAGGAYAAARAIWSGHNMTPADIVRQATTVYNDKWSVRDGNGHCTDETGTHKQVQILPSMGVVFVLPDGRDVQIIPADAVVDMPRDLGTWEPTEDASGNWTGGVWTVPLPDGGTRTIAWKQSTGSVTVSDDVGGVTTTTPLVAGDVVPLIPGSLANDPRTLDKAVTFDLPPGNRVLIFPQLNETYIDGVTAYASPEAEPLGKGVAAEYGLTPIGEYNGKLPVTPDGGSWTANLPGGLRRTISWHTGESYVTVADTRASGTTTTQVPVGHELPLVPFR